MCGRHFPTGSNCALNGAARRPRYSWWSARQPIRPLATFAASNCEYPNVLLLQIIGRDPWAKYLAEKIRAAAMKEFERGNRASFIWLDLVQAEIALGHRDAALNKLEDWRRDAQ